MKRTSVVAGLGIALAWTGLSVIAGPRLHRPQRQLLILTAGGMRVRLTGAVQQAM